MRFSEFVKKTRKGRLEGSVQAGITAYLDLRGDVFWWRLNVSAGKTPDGRFLRNGKKGTPDILCVKGGQLYGIEVKREIGGTVSSDQEIFGANLIAAGGIYAVVRSIAEVENILGPVGPRIQKFAKRKIYPRG